MQHKLKELRKDLNLKQIDVYKDICTRSTYSRFENNKQEIPFELLDLFLKRMGVPLRQYLQFLEKYDSNNFYGQIEEQLPDLLNKNQQEQQSFFENEFKIVQKNRYKNIYALLVFIQIKSMLIDHLQVKISPLTQVDLKELMNFYQNRDFILPIDLAILANLVPAFPCEKLQPLEQLITKKVDISFSEEKDLKKLNTVYLNFVISAIRKNELYYAEYYLKKLGITSNNKLSCYFRVQYLCYRNVINFMKTDDINHLKKALDLINLIDKLDIPLSGASALQEIKLLLEKKKLSISGVNSDYSSLFDLL